MSDNENFLERHVAIICANYARLTGSPLLAPELPQQAWAASLDALPFAVVSHDTQADPVFNYGNRKALALFEMDWADFTRLPSRYSAEPMQRAARDSLLERVARVGYVDDYCGVRVSATGRRFMLRNAVVWNLWDDARRPYGQAALLREWFYL